jgi:hypothetical protein
MNQRATKFQHSLTAPSAVSEERVPKRWRLWDIHRGIHGALLALSFSPDDLRRLVRRAGIDMPSEVRYYDIHRHLCDACVSRSTLSELIEKALDRKFATKTLMLRGIRSGDVLQEEWREAWGRRGLPALFWAFLAHPCANEEIRAGFYADVHALFFTALAEREKLWRKWIPSSTAAAHSRSAVGKSCKPCTIGLTVRSNAAGTLKPTRHSRGMMSSCCGSTQRKPLREPSEPKHVSAHSSSDCGMLAQRFQGARACGDWRCRTSHR